MDTRKKAMHKAIIIAVICAVICYFAVAFSLSLILLVGVGAAVSGDVLPGSSALLLLLGPLLVIVISSIPPYFFLKTSSPKKAIAIYYLVLILGIPLVLFIQMTAYNTYRTIEAAPRMAELERQNQHWKSLQSQLYGTWQTEYKGETIQIEFNSGARIPGRANTVYLINARFFRPGSPTPFEEGLFNVDANTDSPDLIGFDLKSTVPNEMGLPTTPATPYFQYQGIITELGPSSFTLTTSRNLWLLKDEVMKLTFTRVK